MNKLLVIALFLTTTIKSQTLISYDYMETWNWAGIWWTPAVTAGWFTNTSVSATESAVLYGLGTGTSGLEQDWYSLPNVTGLDASKQYQFRFRLASQIFSNSTAGTRGVDVADYVSVQVSTNGGVTYVTELRITGNSNATWPYNTTGTVVHTANGIFTNAAAPAGDVYTSPAGVTTTGPSVITLNLPIGITQVAVDIYCRVNSAGEEWWIDNIELWDLTPLPLPVELLTFNAIKTTQGNLISWSTASEHNSSHFLVERSVTGEFTENSIVHVKNAAMNSTTLINYAFLDTDYQNTLNYYRLTQVDIDGKYKIYDVIAVDNTYSRKKIVKIVNLLGQEILDISTSEIYIEVYDDGTTRKVMK